MKKSEELRIEANKEDNDFSFFNKIKKAKRQEKVEIFEENYLDKILDKGFDVTPFDGIKVTISNVSDEIGIIDFFPKANRLLVRKQNKWFSNGVNWIENNILK